MTGLLNILKGPGVTSHGVISRLRRLTKIKRIGHAGTLDPQAAGVLPVCVGEATKMIPYLDHRRKIYRVEMKLGIVTDTQDMTGQILKTDLNIPGAEDVKKVLDTFHGEYWQVPPMYSAIKKQGKKLYELARKGTVVEREPRLKMIYDLRWISKVDDLVCFDVTCSEGTYVRSLCHDVGQILGCGAVMSFLLRLESCCQPIAEAVTLEEMEEDTCWERNLISIDHALRHYPKVFVSESWRKRITNGLSAECEAFANLEPVETGEPELSQKAVHDSLVRVYLNDCFIGMGTMLTENNHVIMKKSLPTMAKISNE